MAVEPTPVVKQPLTTLEAELVSAVTAVAGVGVGFGLLTGTAEQIIVSVAGVVLGALVQIANALHINSLAKSGQLRR